MVDDWNGKGNPARHPHPLDAHSLHHQMHTLHTLRLEREGEPCSPQSRDPTLKEHSSGRGSSTKHYSHDFKRVEKPSIVSVVRNGVHIRRSPGGKLWEALL